MADDRSSDVLLQASVDLPHQLLALLAIGLARLLLEQPGHLSVAVVVEVAQGSAGIAFEEGHVGIVDGAAGQAQRDDVVFLEDAAMVDCSVDDLELGINLDQLELVDRDHRRVFEGRNVSRADLQLEALVRPIARFPH